MIEMPKIGDEHSQYDGSRMFAGLAELVGFSVDLINFMICQVIALFLAGIFRSYLHPAKVTASVRHAFGLVVGLVFGYFCFGQQAIHIAGLPAVCYIVIRTQNPQIVQRMVMVVALAYLSCIHLHRQYYDFGSCSLDITGPLMIITQKVTSLAFSIHDGFTREEKDLTASQKYHAVQKVPTALEYFSYVMHFQGLMAGPMVFYKDYIEFVEGYNILKHAPGANGGVDKNFNSKEIIVEPSPIKTVVQKVFASCFCAYIFMTFITVYPIKTIKDDDFIDNTSFLYKLWFMMVSTTIVRFKYYHAWLLADAICNNSGLGFNGYAEDGTSKWDMISNINILQFEFATNFREGVSNWNMGTNIWLRQMVYERVPKKYGTILTFSLSALWHGFYPGYYVTFATGAVIIMAARTARKVLRHHFQSTELSRRFYDLVTWLTTRVFMGYATFPFVLLEFKASLRLYLNIYMCLHLVAFATVFIVSRFTGGGNRKISSKYSSTNNSINDKNKLLNGDNSYKLRNDDDIIATASGETVNTANSSSSNNHHDLANGKPQRVNGKIFDITNNKSMINQNHNNKRDKTTVTGIVELKDLKQRHDHHDHINYVNADGGAVRKRTHNDIITHQQKQSSDSGNNHAVIVGVNGGSNHNRNNSVDDFLVKEIDALNAAVQQTNVLPAVLSNGHAKYY